jgi:hypothetical protein
MPRNLTFDTCPVSKRFDVSGRALIVSNFSVDVPGGSSFGPVSYGTADSIYVSGTSFTNDLAVGGLSDTDLAAHGYTMTNGVIKRLKSGYDGAPPQWANPGSWVSFYSRHVYASPLVKILDVYEDGTYVYIQTNLTGNVLPHNSVITSPHANFTMVSCTGADGAAGYSDLIPNRPLFTQWKRTYTTDIGSTKGAIKVFGTPNYVKFTVNTPFSSGTFAFAAPGAFVSADGTDVLWNPVIDLTATGTRTVTLSGATGATGSDARLTFPSFTTDLQLESDQLFPVMSGVSGSGSLTLEFSTNSGFVPDNLVPLLRFRLHA